MGIRGSRSLSRDPSRGGQQRSSSRNSQQQHRRSAQQGAAAVSRERPMTAQPMARNQSMPVNNNQPVYQHQPVTQQHRPAAAIQVNTTIFITNLPSTVSKAQFGACLQYNRIPCPVAMGKDRQNNLIWCTFAHPQIAQTVLNANLWVNGVKLNVIQPQNAI